MRLVILQAAELGERTRVRALFAAERVLAERGVTLPDCLEAIVAEARKEKPHPAMMAFTDAERVALALAFGSGERTGDTVLGLALGPGDTIPHLGKDAHPC